MANATYGRVWYLDTPGIITKSAVQVDAVCFMPAAVSNTFTLNWWDEANPIYEGVFNASSATGVVTETNTDTHTLTAARFPATGVVKIHANSSCVAANKTYHLIGTAGDDHAYTVDPVTTMTNESTKDYHVTTYPARMAFTGLVSTVTNSFEDKWYYIGGLWLPNLILEFRSTSSVVIVYIK